jgi:hypothetical protein
MQKGYRRIASLMCVPTPFTFQFYCTAIFNSALGVTCDLSAELYLPAELDVTCDQPKFSADSIFGGVVSPRREEICIFILCDLSGPPADSHVTP